MMKKISFLALAGWLILASTANSATLPIPSMTLIRTFETKSTNKMASADVLAMARNGSVSNAYNFSAAGKYIFTLSAYGKSAASVYPNMDLKIDGVKAGYYTLNKTTLGDFILTVQVSKGTHTIAIAFTNDTRIGKEDRNAYLKSLSVVAEVVEPKINFTTNAAAVLPAMAVIGSEVSTNAAISTDGTLSAVNVVIEVRNASNTAILKKVFGSQNFVKSKINYYKFSSILPKTLPAANYTMMIGVFSSTWSKTYYWNNLAAPLVAIAKPVPITTPLSFVGVNLSGGEFNQKPGAELNHQYVYPNEAELVYYAGKGMKVIRLPFDINRLQPARNGSLSTKELDAIDKVIQSAELKGLTIILDPHNYGQMNNAAGQPRLIGAEAGMPVSYFADFWKKMAQVYKNQPNVMFNLMNEPSRRLYLDDKGVRQAIPYTPNQWKAAAVAAINAIRSTGAKQKILIPGTYWTGAHTWANVVNGQSNGLAWAGFKDSNFAFEMHQYLDPYSSGTETTCPTGGGDKRLVVATNWARTNKVQIFLGEVGWAANPGCLIEGHAILNYMSKNPDVWMGWTYFAGGPWMGSYFQTVEPAGLGSANLFDRTAMSIVDKHIKK